ncbi:MAG: galactose mutarotase [Muribaculaceae bacterium]|nr:galactose mutarotase [Muribaculaceae bacterium]
MMNRLAIASLLAAVAAASFICSCSSRSAAEDAAEAQPDITQSGLRKAAFERNIGGKEVSLYTLTNADSMEVCITNLGGRIVSIMVPDKYGKMTDVVAGLDSIAPYLSQQVMECDFGGIEGRYAGIIKNGRAEVDSEELSLPADETGHYRNGGKSPWRNRVFDAELTTDTTLTLRLESTSAEDSMPGTVCTRVDYTLHYDNSLSVDITAMADTTTLMDIAQTIYFNLDGNFANSVKDQTLCVRSEQYLPLDSTLTPMRQILMSIWTPMDYRSTHRLGRLLSSDDDQVRYAKGINVYWMLTHVKDRIARAASLHSPLTGITMDMYTTAPVIHVYTMQYPKGFPGGKGQEKFKNHNAVAVTAVNFPDVPNTPQWGSATFGKEEVFRSSTTYKFTVNN